MADTDPLSIATARAPRTARGKRALERREAKDVENPKNNLILRGNKSTPEVSSLLRDLDSIRKPLSTLFIRRHAYHPFEDIGQIEKLCKNYDHSMFTFGSSSKKRPFRLIIGRLFDYSLLDMQEFTVRKYVPIVNFKTREIAVGSKPLVVFQGAAFESDDRCKRTKSLLLDLFSGPRPEQVLAEGIDQAVVCSVIDDPPKDGSSSGPPAVLVRRFRLKMLKSGGKLPRIELEEMGPRFELTVDRAREPEKERWKMAIKVPKSVKPTKVKNIKRDKLARKRGNIHLGKQDMDKIHTVHHGLSKNKKLKQEIASGKPAA
jgi:ribosome production factor 2